MDSKALIWIGGGAAMLYLISRSNGSILPLSAASTSVTTTPTGAAPAGTLTANLSAFPDDPNLLNPNYQLTAAQLAQYAANYLDVNQGASDAVAAGSYPNRSAALQGHWTNYGCAEHRTFYPLTVPSTQPYVYPPDHTQKASSGNFLTTALNVAGTVAVAFAGTNPQGDDYQLNNAEIELLMTGNYICKQIVPMFVNTPTGTANQTTCDYILGSIDNVLKEYV